MKFKHLLLGTVVAIAASGTAQANQGWYMSLGAGVNWVEDANVGWGTFSSVSDLYDYEFDTGYAVVSSLGYDFDNHWRAEFEVAYRHNEIGNFCDTNSPFCFESPATLWELSQMVNVLYDFDLGGNWSASVGAGIGGNLVVNYNSFNRGVDYDDYVLTGQLIGELGYQFADRWKGFASYRYTIMDDPDFDGGPEFRPITMDKTEHTLMLGIRFDLQRDGSTPMRVQRGEAPKQFIVFFGFNKYNLSAEAQRVVAEAAAAAKQYGSASITVVGHTDTVGSNAYNQRLSQQRANSVKSELASNGINGGMISTSGRGETELMVQTGDGVKEPQNRRTTIDLN